ncbi:type II toxin-antitoxin system HipA family toxin [Subdoligranulum sp. OF01-18]|jgi:serine/threonine-protein kinase HipA|uniref:type II toxin-antitoxin system HipA family toxin n=1 Tax=Ruthenibacterium lactatiformans TaxID=1550024 RepID=UPI000E711ECB|nr:type II toxin-antitoxin system HipA family toxin [Ruthenibacterium lactatiformans]RJW79164.1 type II toxin-antitoxin system HipA family toxin [Subdoligranulum sp. OF01-18]
MAQTEKTIYVYENWRSDVPTLIGKLRTSFVRGQENFSFEYDDRWLNSFESSYSLDPDLSLYRGRQYTPLDKSLFGLFADSCPDRWGRMLMNRKEAIDARKEDRKPRKLTESDFLLGVYDESRMGALRFTLEEGGDFLSNEKAFATPPWVNLRTLENASISFENDDSGLNERWLKELLAPGSSLGGARPKATVQAADGALWIAKFPSKHDEYNSGAWEKVVHDLAGLCGLTVPESKLETFSKTGSTFLVKRFDRIGKKRIHFASAMTLLGKTDGASAADGTSYLDLAAYIRANGAEPKKDLAELWKRIVFNMAVSNTDDHLRNHGFILTTTGWRLSPLFDVNPVPSGDSLSLNVSEYDNSIDVQLAIEVSGYFGLTKKEALKSSADICGTVKQNWVKLAERYGFSRGAIEYMRPAFSLEP